MAQRSRAPPSGPGTPVFDEQAVLDFLEAEGIKEVHAYTIWRYLINHPEIDSWDEVDFESLSLPKKFKQELPHHFAVKSSKICERSESSDGKTTKLLVELYDGERVESVVMRHDARATVCVSSQVGCAMGCTFCATGTMGIIGNLSTGEIIEQLIHANTVNPIRNVVFMGMGEPLNNYECVTEALKAMKDSRQFNLKAGHLTVSTVGVIDKMRRLTAELPAVSLALSLHAPNQEVRKLIVPTANKHPLKDLVDALDNHLNNCKKKTTSSVAAMIEYILIQNVNDRPEHAEELAVLLKDRNVMVNLIPYNDTSELIKQDFKAPSDEDVLAFQRVLANNGLITRVRREMGSDIAGACGQLALTKKDGKSVESPDIEDIVKQPPKRALSPLERNPDKSARLATKPTDENNTPSPKSLSLPIYQSAVAVALLSVVGVIVLSPTLRKSTISLFRRSQVTYTFYVPLEGCQVSFTMKKRNLTRLH